MPHKCHTFPMNLCRPLPLHQGAARGDSCGPEDHPGDVPQVPSADGAGAAAGGGHADGDHTIIQSARMQPKNCGVHGLFSSLTVLTVQSQVDAPVGHLHFLSCPLLAVLASFDLSVLVYHPLPHPNMHIPCPLPLFTPTDLCPQDLTAYKKFRDKEVATAARSVISLFRDINPGEAWGG